MFRERGCPGQDLGRVSWDQVVVYVDCGSCGEEMEFFRQDGVSMRCAGEGCGEVVRLGPEALRKLHGCSLSCPRARECLGEEGYRVLGEVLEAGVG